MYIHVYMHASTYIYICTCIYYREGEGDNDLASLAEVGLKELIAAASLVHANAILHPVLE